MWVTQLPTQLPTLVLSDTSRLNHYKVYYVQGWKRGRIYPDFVAMANEIGGVTHVMIFDTKGQHLEGNLDTEYKRKVLETLEGAFNAAGTMVVRDGPRQKGIFQLVFSEQEFLEISSRLDIEAYSTRR